MWLHYSVGITQGKIYEVNLEVPYSNVLIGLGLWLSYHIFIIDIVQVDGV